jgi:hypothetical protein
MRGMRLILLASLLLTACSAPALAPGDPTSSPASTPPSDVSPDPTDAITRGEPPDLVPDLGTAWFGMNLDWARDSAAAVTERLGEAPSVWVQFVAFPLEEQSRGYLDAFIEQIASVDGIGLVTLEPHDGLEAVTPEAAEELALALADYWEEFGTPTIVRFAHEMNGSWYPWGQQPGAYVRAYRTVAEAVHGLAPASAMAWAPNEGSGYPFSGGPYVGDDPALDTNGDGQITNEDDPYAPYWPGDDAVDWVGMSIYHWGLAYPWGENELPPPGTFRALLTGGNTAAHEDQDEIPDFYATYAEGRDKPMGIFETAALYNPAEPGPSEEAIKTAWWRQLADPAIRADFPRLAMINWFEWRKHEPEVGGVIDWRLTFDPDLARRLLAEAPQGWLRFDGIR